MPVHRVRQGECIASIARQYGFGDWRKIYDHPNNAELRELRQNPFVLRVGDRVWIPEVEPREQPGGTDTRHRFRIRSEPTVIRIMLEDEEGEPLADMEYSLVVGEQTFEGMTDEDGLLEETVPADASEGELTVTLDEDHGNVEVIWRVMIGYLDPIDEVTGIQARLNNLGYDCGEANGELNSRTQEALRNFQRQHDLVVNGEADDETREALQQEHGC